VPVEAAADLLGHTPERMLRDYRRSSIDELRQAQERARLGRAPGAKVIRIAGEEP
jgi:hypothetical protein